MKLKNKIVLILVSVMVFSTLSYYCVFRFIILKSFIEAEHNDAGHDMHRCIAAIDREITHLDRFVHDWSSWDDSYTFAVDGNQKYIKENLSWSEFQDQKLNLIHIYDGSGKLVWGKSYDLTHKKEISLDLAKELGPIIFHRLIDQKDPAKFTSGIIKTHYGPMIVASRPILASDNIGQSRGALIMGRLFTNEYLNILSEQVNIDIKVQPLQGKHNPPDLNRLITSLSGPSPIRLVEASANVLRGYAIIRDINGSPALLLEASFPREIMKKGRWAYASGMIFILGAGLIILIAVSGLLRFAVLKPISRLTESVLSIKESAEDAKPLDTGRKDEIGTLSREFSAMVSRLAERERLLLMEKERLHESQRRLADIIDFLPDATFAIDREGKVIAWNHAIENMTGISKQEIVGKIHHDFTAQFYGENRHVLVDLIFEDHEEIKKEYDFIKGDKGKLVTEAIAPGLNKGKGAYIWAVAAPLFDSNGNMAGAIECIRDITENKKAEELLRLHSKAIEQSLDGIIMADLDGVIRYMNTAWAEMHGYAAEELHGSHIKIFHTEEQWTNEVLAFNVQALKSGSFRGRLNHKKRDGTIFPTLSSGFMLKDSKDVPIAVIGIARDITGDMKRENQLRQSQKMEVVGQLAGGVAHDLNNMLSPILGYAEIILADMFPVDPKYDDLMQIKTAAERARNLTHELLAFSRKQVLEMKIVDIAEVVASYGKMLRRTIREDIAIQIRGDLSSGAVRVDVGQIGQVLMNLAVNAQDAMSLGGTITIETSHVALDKVYAEAHQGIGPGEYVVLSFSDTGIGVDARIIDQIFEPFFTTKDRGKGTGLGLATVYGIVKQHGGHITVNSELGKGTIFRVYLPKVDESPEPLISTTRVKKGKRGSETIVVAEDDEGVRVLTTDILEKHGYNVITANTNEELVRVLERSDKPIDLLLTDVIMPGMNGMDLYKQLKTMFSHLKVVFMSGYTDDVVAHHGILEEGVLFIQKPFTISSLTSRIRDALDT
jgi:two-component system, cell cycle sensor histidine kinase and response regulator CckA